MVSPGEDQSAVFQYTNAQASALPEFDSQWVQSGFLRSIDNYRVKQTNQGTTETIIRWKMQYERFDSRNYSAFSEREIYRINNFKSEMTGNPDGTSVTSNVRASSEHRTWKQTTDGFTDYQSWSILSGWTMNRSSYVSRNDGTFKFDETNTATTWFSGTTRTNFSDSVVRKYTSNGIGDSYRNADGSRQYVDENWSGSNTTTATRSFTAPEYNGNSGIVTINRKVRSYGSYGSFQKTIVSIPEHHFYVDKLETLNFHVQGDVQFVEYTTYRSNIATGVFTSVSGAIGFIVGVFTAPTWVGVGVAAVSLDTFVGGLRMAMTGRQAHTLMAMAAGGAYEWVSQTATNNSDFELTDEEKQAAGIIAESALTFGVAATARAGKAIAQLRIATQIFRQTAGACDKITKIGRALKSFQEAGDVLKGTSNIQKSVSNILDNYCFVGTVDVTAYDTTSRWAAVTATPERPLAATTALLRNDYSLGWTMMGVGAVLLLPVLVGRTPPRNAEEQEDTWPEFAWV
jgi:hypothetical protein